MIGDGWADRTDAEGQGGAAGRDVIDSEQGVPQGSPLSPLLSNVVLDELDRELARRGHRFVRYADDGVPRTLKEDRCRRRYRRKRCCTRDEGARL